MGYESADRSEVLVLILVRQDVIDLIAYCRAVLAVHFRYLVILYKVNLSRTKECSLG